MKKTILAATSFCFLTLMACNNADDNTNNDPLVKDTMGVTMPPVPTHNQVDSLTATPDTGIHNNMKSGDTTLRMNDVKADTTRP